MNAGRLVGIRVRARDKEAPALELFKLFDVLGVPTAYEIEDPASASGFVGKVQVYIGTKPRVHP